MIQQWSCYDKIWLDDMGAEAENATCFFPHVQAHPHSHWNRWRILSQQCVINHKKIGLFLAFWWFFSMGFPYKFNGHTPIPAKKNLALCGQEHWGPLNWSTSTIHVFNDVSQVTMMHKDAVFLIEDGFITSIPCFCPISIQYYSYYHKIGPCFLKMYLMNQLVSYILLHNIS